MGKTGRESDIFAKYIRTDELVFKYAKGMRDIIGKEIHTYLSRNLAYFTIINSSVKLMLKFK